MNKIEKPLEIETQIKEKIGFVSILLKKMGCLIFLKKEFHLVYSERSER